MKIPSGRTIAVDVTRGSIRAVRFTNGDYVIGAVHSDQQLEIERADINDALAALHEAASRAQYR